MANTPFTVIVPGIGQVGVVMLKNGVMVFDADSGDDPPDGFLAGIAAQGSLLVGKPGLWQQVDADPNSPTWVPYPLGPGTIPQGTLYTSYFAIGNGSAIGGFALRDRRASTIDPGDFASGNQAAALSAPAMAISAAGIVMQIATVSAQGLPEALGVALTISAKIFVTDADGANQIQALYNTTFSVGQTTCILPLSDGPSVETVGTDLTYDIGSQGIVSAAGGNFSVLIQVEFSFAV